MMKLMPLWLLCFFGVIAVAIVCFDVLMRKKGNIHLLHKLYFLMSEITVAWLLALMALYFFEGNRTAEYIIDSITNLVVFIPVLLLLVALTFARGWERLPRWTALLFIIPTASFVMVWTNPLHHMYYEFFSIYSHEVKFGWFFFVNGAYSYACTLLSVAWVLAFAFREKSALYRRQAVLFAAGNMLTILVSIIATTGVLHLTIVSTPISYVCGVVLLHGLAIFRFHLLDIKPIAVETVLNRISDCYLVLSEDGLVVNFNRAFKETFGKAYGIKGGAFLRDCPEGEEEVGIHTLIASIEACRDSQTTISYEQSLTLSVDKTMVTRYYMVDITALLIEERCVGFVVFFKDISKLKESMKELQNSQSRLIEQERLAFLGQMLGGISHNLKTPIMSISGSVNAVNALVDESMMSLGDPEVTEDDYREIYEEMHQWLSRMQEACSYMSDIITAVKGQAANLNADSDADFMISDVVKQVSLLLRHEFLAHHCSMRVINTVGSTRIRGDINSMVQVVNNLVGNSIDAMKPDGGEVEIELDTDASNFLIKVKDHGPGVSEDVKKHLFRRMITSKGAMGSGLGIYMSNSFIKAKFGGSMWYEDNPEGGAIFGISIPLENVEIDPSGNEPSEFVFNGNGREKRA